MNKKQKKQTQEVLKKVDISCTVDVAEGFTKANLRELPSESVEEIICSFLFNRIPAGKRMEFMDEIYRVLVKGGRVLITVPYWSSMRAVQDYGHSWPPVVEQTFLYFNKAWRDAQKFNEAFAPPYLKEWLDSATNYEGKCDFEFTFGYVFDNDTATRADDTRAHWVKHYVNSVTDLQVTLVKK